MKKVVYSIVILISIHVCSAQAYYEDLKEYKGDENVTIFNRGDFFINRFEKKNQGILCVDGRSLKEAQSFLNAHLTARKDRFVLIRSYPNKQFIVKARHVTRPSVFKGDGLIHLCVTVSN